MPAANVFNVPLNDMLASADPSVAGPELWTRYVASWTPWNHVRTISTLASLVCFIIEFRHSG
ncbi:anthrone oxygenase family protein [Paenibacillus sp. FSL K6-3182]|uniref:anthrone oxygenase family protein n=1 Tax=unclassified Paenibacillus TaxID=185978 RepID=UPI0030CFBBC7